MEVITHFLYPFEKETVLKTFELDDLYFDFPWKKEDWITLDKSKRLVTCSENGNIIGFALFDCLELDEMGHLLKIIVIPDKRKNGAAQRILNYSNSKVLTDRERIFLEVSDQNESAMRLYLSFGFKKINHTKNYYSNGDGAVQMEFKL